ncbi:hypothetical protein [Tepidiforma sp.]|uniref:hypothetical protein n=1 Tax=Tepidiforma sp. TaxID=2682230 RepID=UPI002ADE2CA7|nr:hypothetical protein [Tepidiforma sp.]
MNRLASLTVAALTSGISAAAVAATALSQGLFGSPSHPAPAQEAAPAFELAAQTVPPAPSAARPTPLVIYQDQEPIYIYQQLQTADPGSDRATAPAAPDAPRPAPATTTSPSPEPSPSPAPSPTQAPSPTPAPPTPTPSPAAAAALPTDDRGGTAPRDARTEHDDDRDHDD